MTKRLLLFASLVLLHSVVNAQVPGKGTGTCSQMINGKYHQVPCSQPPSNTAPAPQPTPSGPSQEELDQQERERREAERKAKEAERKRQEEAVRNADEAAKQKEWERSRDEAVREMKGIDSVDKPKLKEIVDPPKKEPDVRASDFLFQLQTRQFSPMNDGGNAIDGPEAPPEVKGLHGLVGGTTWTFGFKWPRKNCDDACRAEINKSLISQLKLFCSSQSDPKQCEKNELPFSPEMYDMAVSMGSAHTFLGDFATRVVWDQATFGKFSIQHKEIFRSLAGRRFDTLDCHSNGALLCLAALRSGQTKAKEVRLFGPQVSPEAMRRWRELAVKNDMKITIYLNEGDPIPALSWNLPAPRTLFGKATTIAWLTDAKTLPTVLSKALIESYFDSSRRIMDDRLKSYGFTVIRNRGLDLTACGKYPSPACHSMKLYETRIVPLK